MDEKLKETQEAIRENLADQQMEDGEISDDLAALTDGGVQAGDIFDYRKMRHEEIEKLQSSLPPQKRISVIWRGGVTPPTRRKTICFCSKICSGPALN